MAEITVVMATYCQEQWLPQALESIYSQSHKPSDVVVVWVKWDRPTLRAIYPFQVLRHERMLTMAVDRPNLWLQRQTGLGWPDTEYVSFFDSDDVMLPGWLEKGLKVAEEIKSRGKIPIVGPSYRMVDEKLFPLQDVVLPEFSMERMMEGCIIPDYAITTTEALRSVGGFFDPEYDPGHPYYFYASWLRILKKYGDNVEVKLLPDIAFLYRQHKKAMHHRFAKTKRKSQENVRKLQEIARHYFPEVGT